MLLLLLLVRLRLVVAVLLRLARDGWVRELGPVVPELLKIVGCGLETELVFHGDAGADALLPALLLVVHGQEQLQVDLFGVLQQEMVDIHVTVQAADHDVAVFLEPQRVLLPARLVPEHLAVGPGGRDVAHEDGLHAAVAQELQLDAQPLHLLEAGLARVGAAVDAGIAVEEIERVQAEDGQLARDDLDFEPAAELEAVALGLGDEVAPDVGVVLEPLVRAG